MFDLGYVADFSTSIPGDPFEPPSPIDPEYQVEGIELEASENIETVLSHLGKGYDIAIAMWLIAKKRQTELLDNIKKFDPIIEVLLLFVRSAPPTEREEGRIIRMVSLSPEVIGMGLFYSQKTRDSMNNVAPGQCGICEAEHHILHSLQYILGKGDIPLTEEELVKYCKTLIKAGYSNALPAGVVKNLPDDAKRVIVDSLFEAKAYHQFIRLRRAINPDPEETLERLKNLPDPTWYMMFGSKMIEHLDPKNIKNVISHLIKHQFDASALDLLAETKPERLFEIFQAFLRAPYFPDGKYDLQIKARAESKATTAIRKIEMVPKERRTELAFEAFENGWAKGVFQYWDKFNLDRDNVELLEQFVALGEAKEFFEPNSGFNLTQIQIGNLARVAVENGHSASVLRNLDNIPTLAKEEITLLAIQKAKEGDLEQARWTMHILPESKHSEFLSNIHLIDKDIEPHLVISLCGDPIEKD